jgi:hypothetical protein
VGLAATVGIQATAQRRTVTVTVTAAGCRRWENSGSFSERNSVTDWATPDARPEQIRKRGKKMNFKTGV